MKHLGICDKCEVPQVVRSEAKHPNAYHPCGLCMKGSMIFTLLLIMNFVSAANITVNASYLGWGFADEYLPFNQTSSNVAQIPKTDTAVWLFWAGVWILALWLVYSSFKKGDGKPKK